MFDLLKSSNDHNYYDGSRIFEWLANIFGLSVDVVNFLICQILALFLASVFRSILHPSKVPSSVRHAYGLILGLFFGYFCFGQQAIHIAGLPAICYIVIRTQSPQIVQRSVMIVALFYLLCIHLHRQIFDYGSYSLDITGPLMIITQKVTSLAYSIHDGLIREQKDLTKAQQYHAVNRVPSALEYFSYVLHFQGLMAGPMVFYKDYINFIEGYNILKKHGNSSNLDNNAKEIILEPSPRNAVVKKILGSSICAFIFMKYITVYPIKTLKDDDFVQNTTIFYKFWYIMMATTIVRFKYYHAWLWADAVCNNAGLGFNGYDNVGNPKWDLLSNINVFSFELATNIRDGINSWNIGTNRWLRFIVYERVSKKYGTMLTFGLSALWHGFYPGYYLTFATGALFVEAARCARKMFRHRFQRTYVARTIYDVITCFITRFSMGYITFPFVLLEFWASIQMYLKLYMCLHIVACFTSFVLPGFIKVPQNDQRKNSSKSISLNTSCEVQTTKELQNNEKAKLIRKVVTVTETGTIYDQENKWNTINDHDNDSTHNRISRLKSILTAEFCVKHDDNEIDRISNKLKEQIEIETKSIEQFIDKTVTGIVELKDDLMRINNEKDLFITTKSNNLHKNNDTLLKNTISSLSTSGTSSIKTNENDVEHFLKKEIDAINVAVQQASVIPAVLSNSHAE